MNRTVSLSLSGLAAATLVLSGAAVANAKIMTGDGIAKVMIGNTVKQVKNKKGAPDSKEKMRTEIPAGMSKFFYYGPDGDTLTVQFFQGVTYAVSTKSPSQKTDTGLHVGSSKSDLLIDYPDVRREAKGLYELGARVPGFNLTIFRVAHKQVTEISVAKYTGE